VREHKITPYDIGQALISVADELQERSGELREVEPEMAGVLHDMAMKVGAMFNRHGSHVFGLPDYKSCTCKRCKRK
jgi:hypothetical protein